MALISFLVVQLIDLSRNRLYVRFGRPPAVVIALIPFGVLILVMIHYTTIHIKYGFQKEQWREAVNAISPELKDNDVIAFYAGFMSPCWNHYAVGYDYTGKHDDDRSPPYPIFKIPRSKGDHAFMMKVQEMLKSVRQMNDDQNSLWVFFSHVQDHDRLYLQLEAAQLCEIDEWQGHGILMKRYAKQARTQP